jgi:hypothetical protein
MSSNNYAMVLDANGTPVWYQLATGGAINVELVPGTHKIAWAPSLGPGIGVNPQGAFRTYNLDDQTVGSVAAPQQPTDPHELIKLPNGNWMLIASPVTTMDLSSLDQAKFGTANNRIVDCHVEEFAPGATTTSWDWKASDHIAVSEVDPTLASVTKINGQDVADIYHCNSLESEPSTGNVMISFRHTDSVYLVSHTTTGNVIWKMGATTTQPEPATTVYKITGDPQNGFFGQHDARFEPNSDISLYDDHSQHPGSARGVQYHLAGSGLTATATKDWEYPEPPTGPSAMATGSFRRYAQGAENLVGWGFRPGSGFTEVDINQKLLYDVTFPNGELDYRAVKIPKKDPNDQTLPSANLLRHNAGLPRPSNSAVSWQGLGSSLTSKPAATAWAPNHMDVFARGTDNQLWQNTGDGSSWAGWTPQGGVLASGPGAAAWSANRLDIFVKGTDDQMWHKWWDGSQWNEWEPLGGVLASDPGVVSWGTNRLDVFVKGTDNQMWHKWWDGSQWNGWEALGGALTSDPGAASWSGNRLDVFVKGTDSQMWHKWWDGAQWNGWEGLGGNLTGGPSATSSSPNQLDIAAPGAGNQVERLEYTVGTSWMPWQPMQGTSTQTPSIIRLDSGREQVFVTGTDSQSQLWTGSIFGSVTGPPPARSAIPSRADAARL